MNKSYFGSFWVLWERAEEFQSGIVASHTCTVVVAWAERTFGSSAFFYMLLCAFVILLRDAVLLLIMI